MAVRLRLDSSLIQAEQLLIYRVLLRDQPAIADLVQSVLGQLVMHGAAPSPSLRPSTPTSPPAMSPPRRRDGCTCQCAP